MSDHERVAGLAQWQATLGQSAWWLVAAVVLGVVAAVSGGIAVRRLSARPSGTARAPGPRVRPTRGLVTCGVAVVLAAASLAWATHLRAAGERAADDVRAWVATTHGFTTVGAARTCSNDVPGGDNGCLRLGVVDEGGAEHDLILRWFLPDQLQVSVDGQPVEAASQ